MRKATSILFLLISITSFAAFRPPFHQTYRTDILIANPYGTAKGYYAFPGEDFMAKWGLLPGDTVAIKVGPNGENYLDNIDLGNASINGLTFLNDSSNKKDIRTGWFGLGKDCQNVKLLGNGSKYVYYGFTFFDPMHFGLSWSCVGNIEAGYIHVDGALMGIQLTTVKGVKYPVNYQKAYFHNCRLENTGDEALYVGHSTYNPDVLIDLTLDSLVVVNAGRDAYQTRNTNKLLIQNCTADGVGMHHIYGHDHGILMGDNIDGAIVRGNVLKNVQGIGIWADGWGTFTIECNNVQAVNWGMMTRNIAWLNGVYTDPQEIGYVKYTIKNNTITPGNGITMESYYDNAGKPAIIEAYNNQCPNKFNMAGGINFTQSNNGPNVTPQCTANIPIPLPVHLKYLKGYKEQSTAVLEWEIATEEGFDHFEVQKSANGQNFQPLVNMARQPVTIPSYKLIDVCPYPSSYYRLKMIDQDGRFTYSSIVNIDLSLKPVDYTIYDVLGRKVLQRTVLSLQAIKNDLQSSNRIKPGLYFIRSNSSSEKFIKK